MCVCVYRGGGGGMAISHIADILKKIHLSLAISLHFCLSLSELQSLSYSTAQ